DDVIDVPVAAGLVHGHDVGVIECRGGLGLTDEPLPSLIVLMAGEDHLDRDQSAEQVVGGLVDGSHASGAQTLLDRVVPESAPGGEVLVSCWWTPAWGTRGVLRVGQPRLRSKRNS